MAMTKPRTVYAVHKTINTPIVFVTENIQDANEFARREGCEYISHNPKCIDTLENFERKFNREFFLRER